MDQTIEAKLKVWNKKTISKAELEKLLHTDSDAGLWPLVSDMITDGYLSPIKASGTNGNRLYPLYLKYRIEVREDYSEALAEIAMLHPMLLQNGYLYTKPDLYLRYQKQIQMMNSYLFDGKFSVPVSKKERSFDIFHEEKQLDNNTFRLFLDRLGLTPETLGYYETPEYCFNDFIHQKKTQMTLLICENKDMWFNIRRRMFEDSAGQIFQTKIDGVIYGCGNKISEAGALSEYTRFMRIEKVQYLYWGDIDRAGLDIYMSLIRNNADLDIRLFVPAYEEMLRLAEDRTIPYSEDHREKHSDYESIYKLFNEGTKNKLAGYLEANKRIPQEIINYEMLMRVMR